MHCFVKDFTLAQTCDSVCVRTATQRALLLKLLKALNHTILISLISCMSYTTSVTMQVPNDTMYDLFTYIWVISGVNVGKCTIHWVSGVYFRLSFSEIWALATCRILKLSTVPAKQPRDTSRSSNQERNGSRRRIRSLLSTVCWFLRMRLIQRLIWGYELIKKNPAKFKGAHSKSKHLILTLYINNITSKNMCYGYITYIINILWLVPYMAILPWRMRLGRLRLTWVVRIAGSRWIIIIQTYHAQGRMLGHPWLGKTNW